ncbi:MAG: imelysin family protein [Rhodobacteraceae bacterium]|nr:imelysin family protein [Paracoccaceae bacterium]
MRSLPFALALLLAAAPARADTARALDAVLLPGFERFAGATAALARAAAADCTPEALRAPYDAAWDAWVRVGFVGIGPSAGANLSIAFWPDARGATQKALREALAGDPPATADEVARSGAALRGLTALDAILGGDGYRPEGPECRLAAAVAADLAAQAEALAAAWTGHAALMKAAGEPGNATYLTPAEATSALYTQLLAGLEFAADQRLGRPLGEAGRARPARAEAWRTGRPVPNLMAELAALQELALALAPGPLPRSDAAFAEARTALAALSDPTLQDLEDPQARLRAEAAQQRIRAVRDALTAELGPALGVTAGFNALDGD